MFGAKVVKQDHPEAHGCISPASRREALRFEDDRHPIALPPDRTRCLAPFPKAYLRSIGVLPVLDRQPDFPRELLVAAASAYFEGCTECRSRLALAPIVFLG